MANPNPAAVSPATDVAAASSFNSTLKAGWKTTEMWLTTILFAGLGTVIEQLVSMMKDQLANPAGANPIVLAAMGVAIPLLGLAIAWAKVQYTKSRTALKNATTPPANDTAAAALVNGAKVLLAVLLVAAMLAPSLARAQDLPCPEGRVRFGGACLIESKKIESCAELLDAGTPAPAVKAEAGQLIPSDAWVMSSARMCAAGQAEQTCQAVVSSEPVMPYVIGAGAGVVIALLAGGLIAYGTGHLK
jgi:hypothetical protein